MKKVLLLIGLLVLSSCVNSSIDYTPLYNTDATTTVSYFNDATETEIKCFNQPTKAIVQPSWVTGNKISVYSIDNDSTVVCISICEVYDINNNLGKITATVAKDCMGYFAAFPSYLFDYQIGDKIDLNENKGMSGQINLSNVHYSGEFGDACMMTSWCDWCEGDGYFKFNARSSIIKFDNIRNSNFPIHFIIYKEGIETPYYYSETYTNNFPHQPSYFPIDIDRASIYIEIYYHNNKRLKRFPLSGFKPIDVGEIITITDSDIK